MFHRVSFLTPITTAWTTPQPLRWRRVCVRPNVVLWLISPEGPQLITASCFRYVIPQPPFRSKLLLRCRSLARRLKSWASSSRSTHTHTRTQSCYDPFLERTSDRCRPDDTPTRNQASLGSHWILLSSEPVGGWNSAWCMNFIYYHHAGQKGLLLLRPRGAGLNARGTMTEQTVCTHPKCIVTFVTFQ